MVYFVFLYYLFNDNYWYVNCSVVYVWVILLYEYDMILKCKLL